MLYQSWVIAQVLTPAQVSKSIFTPVELLVREPTVTIGGGVVWRKSEGLSIVSDGALRFA
jgi:hypothetical protein